VTKLTSQERKVIAYILPFYRLWSLGEVFGCWVAVNDFHIGGFLILVASCLLERMIKRARLEHSDSGCTVVDLGEELASKTTTF
jgi:hypothetical protein